MDFNAILGQLTETLKSINWEEIITAVTTMAKQLVEMIKPLLANLTAGTTDPTTPTQKA